MGAEEQEQHREQGGALRHRINRRGDYFGRKTGTTRGLRGLREQRAGEKMRGIQEEEGGTVRSGERPERDEGSDV